MNDKSFVSMERKCCPVCGKEFDTSSIILDKRGRPTLNRYTVTGWGLCPEHKKLFENGFVALVAIDEAKSSGRNPDDVWRTGEIMHVRRHLWPEMFNVPIPDDVPLVWVDPQVINALRHLAEIN